jgi:DNA topoisomerase II
MTSASAYKKLDNREHVLLRPGMYVGSLEPDACEAWVYDDATKAMAKRTVRYVPALYKIFDEVLINAVDHAVRLRSMPECAQVKNVKVAIDRSTGYVEVWNDGEGIAVEKHEDEGIYVPELIFGHMLTSCNYDDETDAERVIGGQNGIGAKACNIFSKVFEIETVDAKAKRCYKQTFYDNMATKSEPEIKYCVKKPYTRVRFLPDYHRFGFEDGRLSDDMHAIFVKRVHDVAGVTDSGVAVHLDGAKLETRSFERYADLYLGSKAETDRVYDKLGEGWEVVIGASKSPGFQHVSFVNGLWTMKGGKHVDHVANVVSKKLAEMIVDRKKDAAGALKPQHIRDNMFLFLLATVPNPTFDSQTKETLTTPAAKWGGRLDVSDRLIEKLYKSSLAEKAIALSLAAQDKNLRKTDGKKRCTLRGIAKLDDANWAGTARSAECTLILTEGDSAKSMAIAGLSEVGRDKYGVFPLRGKVMNVCDVSVSKIADNEEISNIKKILGLESGKTYDDARDLRYGRLLLMCDSDEDGKHIQGLIMNLFHRLWPSLLRIDGFVATMLTPIVKVRKGPVSESFYNLAAFREWMEAHENGKGYAIKYYKGLGTSTAAEAKEYFRALDVRQYVRSEACDTALDLAFNKKRADDRKAWLGQHDPAAVSDSADRRMTYDAFVHKELIHFSAYDVARSIPSMCDGLKISQRKILYCCFKRNLVSEIRVAQLSGYVSEHAAYHHGEASLQSTIVGMAQDYVGSNNVNLLLPIGQFGTRIQGGKDSASARYIHTHLSPIARALFVEDDDRVLHYQDDDGYKVEPTHYVPVLPMVLVNGASGIGTGFSTSVPCFDPEAIADAIEDLLRGDAPRALKPWYRGFLGEIIQQDSKLASYGKYERIAATRLRVVELPIGVWTEDFKEHLEAVQDAHPEIKSVKNNYQDTTIDFVLEFSSREALDAWIEPDPTTGVCKAVAALKLASNRYLGTQNMYLFDERGVIKKYNTVEEILQDFFRVRMDTYERRKAAMLAALEKALRLQLAKIRFLESILTGELDLKQLSKADLEARLEREAYPPDDDGSYDYLTRMPIHALTTDKLRQTCEQRDRTREQLKALDASSLADLYRADLARFRAAYSKIKA